MQTVNLAITNEVISYKYKFSRLLEIQYPHHPENNVSYIYNQAGRITKLDGNEILDGTKKGQKTEMTSVFMHRTDWNGIANHSSKGCMIFDGRQWRNVEKQLKKSSNIFLRVNR